MTELISIWAEKWGKKVFFTNSKGTVYLWLLSFLFISKKIPCLAHMTELLLIHPLLYVPIEVLSDLTWLNITSPFTHWPSNFKINRVPLYEYVTQICVNFYLWGVRWGRWSVSNPSFCFCFQAETSRVSLSVLLTASRLLETLSGLSLARNSSLTPGMATSTPAPPTWALAWGPLSTLTFLDGPRRELTSLRLGARLLPSSPVELVVSLAARLELPMTFPTSTDWDTQRCNLSRPWLMVSTLCMRKTLSSKRSTDCNLITFLFIIDCFLSSYHFSPPAPTS